MKEFKKQLGDLEASFASFQKKYEESKGYDSSCDSPEKHMEDALYSMMVYTDKRLREVVSYISHVEEALYQHKSAGHLPQIKSAGKMKNALDILGISDDYEVVKPVIFAKSKYGLEVQATYAKDAKRA